MATIQELEVGMKKAYDMGNMEYARVLGAALVEAQKSSANQIPGSQIPGTETQPAPRTLLDRIKGIGETGLTLATGATTGTLGALGGVAKTIGQNVIYGTSDELEKNVVSGMQAGTYLPKTEAGQEYVGDIGKLVSNLPPVIPQVAGLNAIGQAVRQQAPLMGAMAQRAGQAAQRTGQAVAAPVSRSVQAGREFVVGSKSEIPEISAQPMAAYVAAPAEVLADKAVRARPDVISHAPEVMGKREKVLDAIGIPQDSRRLGAVSGNKSQINNEIMISKLDGADRMKQQLQMESEKLGDYATAIQRDTGGTVGANPLQRGEAISAPLEGYQKWYDDQVAGLYKAADQAAVGQGGIEPSRLKAFLNEPANFKGDGVSVARDMRNELKRLGIMDKDGDVSLIDANTAERIRQEANRLYDPLKVQTKVAVKGLKEALDDDVMSVLPADVYKDARAMRAGYHTIFDDPKGLAQILDISGPNGINRAVSLDTLPDKLATFAVRDSAQFKHIASVLENLPTPELRAQGRQAMAEIRSHLVEKMIGKNVDATEASLGGAVQWKGTDKTLSQQLAPYRGKLNDLLGEELANRIETLRVGARILTPFDPNPSGTATTARNLQTELSKRVITGASSAVGGVVGGLTGGPMGAAGGAVGGHAAAKKIIQKRDQRAIDSAIVKSLNRQKAKDL